MVEVATAVPEHDAPLLVIPVEVRAEGLGDAVLHADLEVPHHLDRLALVDEGAQRACTLVALDIGTADLVVAAIRGALIDVRGADEMKRRWESELRFRMGLGSFSELA